MTTYTHGYHESVLRSHRSRTVENSAAYLVPRLRSGMSVLDVGSGAGTITADLARRVSPGRVAGVERADDAAALGRAEAERQGVGNVEFVVSDVHDLDFPDDSFDVVHAHQVLQHVADPVRALAEMRRVCRPGGTVAARDSDYAAFTWYPASGAITEWLRLYDLGARANGGEPDAGRRLLSWALAAGFTDVTPSSSTWTYATPDTREWWGGLWADRITVSDLARQLVDSGLATQGELEAIARGWRDWAAQPDGWFALLHGEILAAKGDA